MFSESKSCPRAAWVVKKVFIMVWSDSCVSSTLSIMEQRDGESLDVLVAGASSSATTVGSIYSSPWGGSILCHFLVPSLVARVFFCALLCFKTHRCYMMNKLRRGRTNNPKYFKILRIETILRHVSIDLYYSLNEKRMERNGGTSDKGIHEYTPINRNRMHVRNMKNTMTCDPIQ